MGVTFFCKKDALQKNQAGMPYVLCCTACQIISSSLSIVRLFPLEPPDRGSFHVLLKGNGSVTRGTRIIERKGICNSGNSSFWKNDKHPPFLLVDAYLCRRLQGTVATSVVARNRCTFFNINTGQPPRDTHNDKFLQRPRGLYASSFNSMEF